MKRRAVVLSRIILLGVEATGENVTPDDAALQKPASLELLSFWRSVGPLQCESVI